MEEDRTEQTAEEQQTPQEPPTEPAQAPPPRQERHRRSFPVGGRWGCLIAALVLFVIPVFVLAVLAIVGLVAGAGPRLALVHVEGVITASRGGGGVFAPGEAGSERIVQLLRQAREDDDVKGVLIRVNSPGGSAAGSQEIYDEIRRVRRAGKPVYISMGDVAASGGYYIAAAADRIYADSATATGSIGVIWSSAHFSELMDRLGIDLEVVKSGQFKDMGSPHRPLTPAERDILQGIIDDIFDQFVDAVSEGRRMPKETVRELATGRVYTGRQAKQLRLVDEIGGLHETTEALGRATGLGTDPLIETYEREGLLRQLFGGNVRSWNSLLRQIPGNMRVPTLE